MAEQSGAILLNGGRDLGVALVAGADEFLVALLEGAPVKRDVATLRVVQSSAGQPLVAVLVAGRQVGFLSQADAENLSPALATCEQRGEVPQARSIVTASWGAAGKPALTLSLAELENLLAAPQAATAQAATPQAAAPPGALAAAALPAAAQAPGAQAAPTRPAQPDNPAQLVQPAAALTGAGIAPSVPNPRVVFAGAPLKKPGWWGRRSGVEKGGLIAVPLMLLALAVVITLSAGGGGKSVAAASSVTTVARTSTTVAALATTTTGRLTAATASVRTSRFFGADAVGPWGEPLASEGFEIVVDEPVKAGDDQWNGALGFYERTLCIHFTVKNVGDKRQLFDWSDFRLGAYGNGELHAATVQGCSADTSSEPEYLWQADLRPGDQAEGYLTCKVDDTEGADPLQLEVCYSADLDTECVWQAE